MQAKTGSGGTRKGAGRKSNAAKGLETRGHVVAVKLTPAELELLAAHADAHGVEISVWIRNAALAAQ